MQEIKANPTVRHTTPLQLLAAFAATVAVLFVLLLGACALPAQPVLEHVYDSAQTIQQEGLYPEYFGFKLFQMDNYTDTIMLFEAAAMGEQDPLTAMMTATAYNVDNFETMAGDLAVYCERTIPLATGAQKAVQLVPFSYARYWHGYLLFLKPLLLFFSLSDIRMMNAALQLILAAGVLLLAFRKRGLRLALPMGLALLVLNPVSTALSMQFSSIYYLTLLGLLIMLLTESWDRSWGYLVFLFLGIGTAFFDFLTYPACAVGTCLALQALMSWADGKTRLLKTVGSGAAWAFGYGGMWSGKWLAASLITGNSVMRDAVEQAQYRSGGEVTAAEGGVNATFGAVLGRNLGVLANPAAAVIVLALLGLLVWLLVTKRCRFALERASLLSLAVAFAVPFVWYFLLRNHSLVHCWMTYRNLSAAVFALSGGLCFGLKGNGSPEN